MSNETSISWRYQQDTPDQGRWTSTEVFTGRYRDAVQGVIAGHLMGQPRAAIEEGTGRVVYALDAKGLATAAAVKLFNALQLAGEVVAPGAPTMAPWAKSPEAALRTRKARAPR